MKVFGSTLMSSPSTSVLSNSIEYLVDVLSRLVVVSDVVILRIIDYYFLSLKLIAESDLLNMVFF